MPVLWTEATRSELLPLTPKNGLCASSIQYKGKATVFGKDYNILVIDEGVIMRREIERYHNQHGKRYQWM